MNTTFLKNGRMVLGILFVLGCCACSDESVPAGKVTEESVYDRMGRLHNEGLDYGKKFDDFLEKLLGDDVDVCSKLIKKLSIL